MQPSTGARDRSRAAFATFATVLLSLLAVPATVADHDEGDGALLLTLAVDPAVAAVGQAVTLTLNATNAGNETLEGEVELKLPRHFSAGTLEGCDLRKGRVTCPFELTGNASAAWVLSGTATKAGKLKFKAEAEAGDAEAEARAQLIVRGQQADLEATIEHAAPAADAFRVGEAFTGVATFRNHGPETAAATLTLKLPRSFAQQAATPDGCALRGLTYTCKATLAPDATLEVALEGAFTKAGDARFDADAKAGKGVTDPVKGNSRARVEVDVQAPQADLAVSVQASAGEAAVGETVAFNVTWENLGPENATGARLEIALPKGTDLEGLLLPEGCAPAKKGIACVRDLAAGDAVHVEVGHTVARTSDLKVAAETKPHGVDDPDKGNNKARAKVDVRKAQSDLAVDLTWLLEPTLQGDAAELVVNVTNHGPDDVSGAVLKLKADGLDGAAPDGCMPRGDTWRCLIDLPSGGSMELLLAGTAGDGELEVEAEAKAPKGWDDPEDGNNEAELELELDEVDDGGGDEGDDDV